jgi:hypothetical protein
MASKILFTLYSIGLTVGLVNCVFQETLPSLATPEFLTTTTPQSWIAEFGKQYHTIPM